jgi:hypothetical protein
MTFHAAVSNVFAKEHTETNDRLREAMTLGELSTPYEIEQLGKALLHQQLYVIGRDIVSRHGNLLMNYGCFRMQSPISGIPSTYSMNLGCSSRLALRGFGVFVGDDAIGGIFVHRYTFIPRWMPSSKFAPMAWLPGEMPRTRVSRYRGEKSQANGLLKRMIAWFIEYERWIDELLGVHFRIGQLSHFPGQDKQPIYWNLSKSWSEVYERCQ